MKIMNTMKNLLAIASLFVLATQAQAVDLQSVTLKPLESVELSYDEFAVYDIELVNTTRKQVNVKVIDPETGEQIKGFGLTGRASLSVGKGNVLRLKNTSLRNVKIKWRYVEAASSSQEAIAPIAFTLHNSSARSIPLVIPGVMNPNLSPFSNSGVSLAVGQKIYYGRGMNKKLLFVVDETIRNGDKIDVARLVRNMDE
jgi:hypothetical protein